MIYKTFSKDIRKMFIDNNIGTKEVSELLGESQQNIIGKINRESIRLMDVEKILDVMGYELKIVKVKKE